MRKMITALCLGVLLMNSRCLVTLAAVTDVEVEELLQQYEMTNEELSIVLEEFGTSVNDFDNQEELADALDFYLNHLSEMKDLEEFFAMIGLTEEETDTIIAHLDALDQDRLQVQINAVSDRMENFLQLEMGDVLTVSQRNELSSIYTSLMSSFQLQPTYVLVDANGVETKVTYEQLLSTPFTSDRLLVQLYTSNGVLLGDVELSSDKVSADFFVSSLEKVTDLGELVGELPNTASPYAMGMLIGVTLMISALSLFAIRKRLTERWGQS